MKSNLVVALTWPYRTHRVVVLLLQLSLLLLLPLGLHLHGLSYQVSQDGDWLGLADKWVLNIDKKQTRNIILFCSHDVIIHFLCVLSLFLDL